MEAMSAPGPNGGKPRGRKRRHMGAYAIFALLTEALAVWRRGYGLGGNVIVRCQDGHLFTTLWVPGVSVKSARLGMWRIQRCPVGHHWAIVTPVAKADLGPLRRRRAAATHDVPIP